MTTKTELVAAVAAVPKGGYAATADPDVSEALWVLDCASPEERRAAFAEIPNGDLARLYLTAEDANYHTMNQEVEAVLSERGVTYGQYRGLQTDAAAVPSADVRRTRDALRFYVERVTWSSSDRAPGGERDQYMRLLEYYTTEAVRRGVAE